MKSVTVVGVGNIGSHLVAHLARMPEVGHITIVDKDSYERRNLDSQDIAVRDLDRPKARVQARRLQRIRPGLRVAALVGSVENLPVGRLRADAVLACVDSRRARQSINEISWRLGVPWIDGGVLAEQLLARVNVYVPGHDQPCLECAWSASDYERIEQVYPCDDPAGAAAAATGGPSALGALAAALQALECRKILRGEWDHVAVASQITVDAQSHKFYFASSRRNPDCRFDHGTWRVERLNGPVERVPIGRALELGDRVELEHKPFARRLTCRDCGTNSPVLRLLCSLSEAARKCPRCRAPMVTTGFDLLERLDATLPARVLARSLRDVGLRDGDIFHAGNGTHYEITCDRE